MTIGLSVSRLINVQLVLTPIAAQGLNFDSMIIVGDSDVINVHDRIRSYNTFTEVADDFDSTTPEYAAAQLFFQQIPQPSQLYIGRWAQAATAGLLLGGPLTATQQLIATWQAILNGGFHIRVDGAVAPGTNITGINLSGATNMNGVATLIQTAVQTAGGALALVTVTWNGSQFIFRSGTTGIASSVVALTAPTAGNDLSTMLLCTAATLSETVQGIAAETALQAVQILDNLSVFWYGLTFASTHTVDADFVAIAGYIEASSAGNVHLFGLTTNEAAALLTGDTTSIGAQLKALGYRRTFDQWSSTIPYANTSLFGRGCTVNFDENLTVITFAWKQEPGVVAENLGPSQADALDANNYNYFANYNNGTATTQRGQVVNGDFIDNTWDLDWLVNRIQTDVYNLLYTSPTKVPQTDAGMHLIKTTIEASCSAGVNNGTLAPGTWNAAGFGQLQQGDFLNKGFYVYQPPLASQPQSEREARHSVPFQVAVKLAGAVHDVAITVNVNR